MAGMLCGALTRDCCFGQHRQAGAYQVVGEVAGAVLDRPAQLRGFQGLEFEAQSKGCSGSILLGRATHEAPLAAHAKTLQQLP